MSPDWLVLQVDIIFVGILLLISKPLELASGNWKPPEEQCFEEEEKEEDKQGEAKMPLCQHDGEEEEGTRNENGMKVLAKKSPQSDEGVEEVVIHLEYDDQSSIGSSSEKDITD